MTGKRKKTAWSTKTTVRNEGNEKLQTLQMLRGGKETGLCWKIPQLRKSDFFYLFIILSILCMCGGVDKCTSKDTFWE